MGRQSGVFLDRLTDEEKERYFKGTLLWEDTAHFKFKPVGSQRWWGGDDDDGDPKPVLKRAGALEDATS